MVKLKQFLKIRMKDLGGMDDRKRMKKGVMMLQLVKLEWIFENNKEEWKIKKIERAK